MEICWSTMVFPVYWGHLTRISRENSREIFPKIFIQRFSLKERKIDSFRKKVFPSRSISQSMGFRKGLSHVFWPLITNFEVGQQGGKFSGKFRAQSFTKVSRCGLGRPTRIPRVDSREILSKILTQRFPGKKRKSIFAKKFLTFNTAFWTKYVTSFYGSSTISS